MGLDGRQERMSHNRGAADPAVTGQAASGRARDLLRWVFIGTVVVVAVAVVQSIRHPARLWRSGRMGRVLAWGIEPPSSQGGTRP
jgi:hypothetical protein